MSWSRSFRALALSFVYSICLNAGEAVIVESLEIEGTRRPLELQTRRDAPLDLETVNADVRRLYGTGWFDDIRVEQPSPGHLVFHVVEQPRFTLREVRFEPAEHKRKVKIGPGTPINELIAQRIASDLRRELVADGYSYARVEPKILPVAYRTADLLLRVESGPVRNIGQVRFTGSLGLEEKQLRKALRGVRVKTIVPLVWKHRSGFSDKALDADMARLRSLYLTHGYFDAEIGPAEVSHEDGRSTVTIPIDSGKRHDLEITVEGIETDRIPNTMKDLCNCLLAERREAEREGRIDFDVQISLRDRPNPEPTVVATSVEAGEPFRLGRLDFQGHHSVGDRTLRRTMKIDEGDLFDPRMLEKSIARIGRLGVFEPLGDENIVVVRNSATNTANVTITVKERQRGRWALSGPAAPIKLAGPFQAAISSRLPGWGSGILEGSTYYATLSLTGITGPFARVLDLTGSKAWMPFVSVHRPVMPGQEWFSGFSLSPQLGWKYSLASYGVGQIQSRIPAPGTPPAALVMPVERDSQFGFLICEKRRSAWLKAARYAPTLVDWLFALH